METATDGVMAADRSPRRTHPKQQRGFMRDLPGGGPGPVPGEASDRQRTRRTVDRNRERHGQPVPRRARWSALWAVAALMCASVLTEPATGLVLFGEADFSAPRRIMHLGRFCFATSAYEAAQAASDVLRGHGLEVEGPAVAALDEELGAMTDVSYLQFSLRGGGAAPQYLVVHTGDAVAGDDVLAAQLSGGELGREQSMACEEFMESAITVWGLGPVAPGQLVTHTRIVWQESRPRFWYVSAVNCRGSSQSNLIPSATPDGESGMFAYSLTFMNPGGYFSRQFSFDELGMYEARLIAWVAFATVFCWFTAVGWNRSRSTVATGFRSITVVIGVQLLALSAHVLSSHSVATSGRETALSALADLADVLSDCFLQILLVALMKGWSTVINELKQRHKLSAAVVAALLVGLYVALFTWSLIGGTPASALYLYDSPPGIALIIVRVVVPFWFVKSLGVRVGKIDSDDVDRRRFYIRFAVLGLLWYSVLPLSVLLASMVPPWYKARVVGTVDLVTGAITVALLAHAWWPSRVNAAFNSVREFSEPEAVAASGTSQQEVDEERRRKEAQAKAMIATVVDGRAPPEQQQAAEGHSPTSHGSAKLLGASPRTQFGRGRGPPPSAARIPPPVSSVAASTGRGRPPEGFREPPPRFDSFRRTTGEVQDVGHDWEERKLEDHSDKPYRRDV